MPNKPKILIFIDWYKPGYKAGGPIRSISNMVDYIYDKVDIYIVTRNNDYLEETPYKSIQSNHWNTIDNATVYYFSKNNLNLKNIKKLIKDINPNIIYCNSLYSPFFTLIPLFFAKKLKINSILAVRGMLSKGSLGIKSRKKKLFLMFSKILGLYKHCTFHGTNEEEEKDIILHFGYSTNIIIAQNLPEKKIIPFNEKTKDEGKLRLVSVGRISPEKNTLYSLEILKNVTQQISYTIYGPIYNNEYWNKCKEVIRDLPSNIEVEYKGVLPHSTLDETLKTYHALFLPSTGENFGHIIIEAMMNSCIPIISDQTPWKNLEQQKVGFDISLKDQIVFANKLDLIASFNQKKINDMSKKAYHYALKVINNKEIVEDYYKLFQLQD